MKTDPFADLPESPVKAAAYTVQARMSDWINREVEDLKKDMAEKAEVAINKMTSDLTQQFADTLTAADKKLEALRQRLAEFKPKFIEANLPQLADELDQAIKAHEEAVKEQKAKIQGYGKLAGGLARKAVTSGL